MLQKFDSLITSAKQISENSTNKVGAALLCRDGSIFSAAEFEFKSGIILHAELGALTKALENANSKFTALAVYGKESVSAAVKSTLLQYGDIWVIFAKGENDTVSTTLSKL